MVWDPCKGHNADKNIIEEIKEPPCKNCSYFRPHRKFEKLKFDGVVICIAEEMYSDFSCYKKGEDKIE